MPELTAMLIMGGVGVFAALILGVAAVSFAVKPDPREKRILESLPGANCGACGLAGCAEMARTLATDPGATLNCPALDADARAAISEILGQDLHGGPDLCAFVRCRGGAEDVLTNYQYVGPAECTAAHIIAGGAKACRYGCLGYGTCAAACPFDALHMGRDGLPRVDIQACTGCGKCMEACPRGILTLLPRNGIFAVGCHSLDPGAEIKRHCRTGCIQCGLCAQACPFDALTVSRSGAAVIDQARCRRCGLCTRMCPTGVIAAAQALRPVRIDKTRCNGCSLCARVCPVEAISGHIRGPYDVNEEACIGCGICRAQCPVEAIGDACPC